MRGTLATIMGTALTTGCSTTNQVATQDQNYNAPLSIYSAMDSTSLVYSDPMAASRANDNPLTDGWALFHPVGHRRLHGESAALRHCGHAPYLFGYTAEDSADRLATSVTCSTPRLPGSFLGGEEKIITPPASRISTAIQVCSIPRSYMALTWGIDSGHAPSALTAACTAHHVRPADRVRNSCRQPCAASAIGK